MKLEYWFELPSSLACLLEDNSLLEDKKQAINIESCFIVSHLFTLDF